jgi:uncharacterized membrane protein (UPF0127 family)
MVLSSMDRFLNIVLFKHCVKICIVLGVFSFLGCTSANGQSSNLVSLSLGRVELLVEVADTPSLRQQGLMNRQSLPENQGMLFVFPDEQVLQFWMKDTIIPLSIAYIDSSGIIVTIRDMQPRDLTPVSSIVPAQFALEVNQGWFELNSIRPGDRVILPSEIKIPRL